MQCSKSTHLFEIFGDNLIEKCPNFLKMCHFKQNAYANTHTNHFAWNEKRSTGLSSVFGLQFRVTVLLVSKKAKIIHDHASDVKYANNCS